jgi:hypothetical protein
VKKIESLYKLTQDAAAIVKMPFVIKRVNRAMDAGVDDIDSRIEDKRLQIENSKTALAKGDTSVIKTILYLEGDIQDLLASREVLEGLKAEMNAEVTE